jgi:hypothetical protein
MNLKPYKGIGLLLHKFRYPVLRPDKVPMPDKAGIEEYERRREAEYARFGKEGLVHFDHVHLQWFADGLFYNDTREPFIGTDITAVTLSTTPKALYPASNFPVLGGQYWSRIGKKLKIRMFGRMTTDGTAGNMTWAAYYGTGADANGTVVTTTPTAVAGVVSATSKCWWFEGYCHCRSIGSTGTLFFDGISHFQVALLLSTNAPLMIPDSAPAVSGSLDLTAANIISVQFQRSGAGVWTMQTHDMEVIAMN